MKKKFLSLLAVAFAGLFLLASCGKTYLVSFEEEGGSEVADVEVKEGELVTLPANPTKEGLTFDGWYTDPNCTKAFDATQPVVEEITLYAKWSVKLTFDSKGGSAVDAIVAKASSVYELPANPTRDGYAFVGWYTDEAYTKALPALVFPAKNTTAYAKWLALDVDAKHVFSNLASNDPNAFEVEDNKFTATESKGSWTYVNAKFFENLAGYDTVVADVIGTEGVEIMFKFEGAGIGTEYTEGETKHTQINEKTFVLTGKEQRIVWNFRKEVLAKSGSGECRFGFFLAPGKEGKIEGEPNEEVVGVYVEVKSLFACRALAEGEQNKEYAVTYVVNNGTPVVETQFVTKGAKATAPTAPTREGYTFGGWYTDDKLTKAYDWNAAVEANVTLYAKWDKTLHDVTFNIGGTGTAPETINVGFLPALPTVKADGLVVKKWFYDAEFKKEAKKDDMLTADVTLYAKWEKAISAEKVVNMLEDTFASNADVTVTVNQETGALTVKKNNGEWSGVSSTLKVSAIADMAYLRVTIKGTNGQKLLFKIGEVNGPNTEKWVECNGEVQYYEFEFDASVLDVNKAALTIMPGAGVNGESGDFVITQLEFANVPAAINMLNEFTTNTDCTATVNQETGALTVKKNSGEWAGMLSSFKISKITNMAYLRVTIKGTNGQKLLFKIGEVNGPNTEKWVECNGEVQYYEFEFDASVLDINKAALTIMPGAGVNGESGDFVITQLEFAAVPASVDVRKGWVNNDKDAYTIVETPSSVKITKNEKWVNAENQELGTDWCFVKNSIDVEDGRYTTLVVEFVADVAGQELIFNFNGSEQKPRTEANTNQTVEIVLNAAITVANFQIFVNPGHSGSCTLTITNIYLK